MQKKRSSSSSTSSQSSGQSKSKPPHKSEQAERSRILEERRLRNIESAKRSRARLRNETAWMQVQMSENEDRMRYLEKKVKDLTDELRTPQRNRSSKHSPHPEKRPDWFGEPF